MPPKIAHGGTIAVEGLSPLIRDFSRLSRGGLTQPILHELKKVAEPVAASARRHLASFLLESHGQRGLTKGDKKAIAGFTPGIRYSSAVVRQQNRKTTKGSTDIHKFGDLQMRKALLPALRENEAEIERRIGKLLDRLTDPNFDIGNPGGLL